MLKRIKTKDRCSLSAERISQLIRLCLDGPPIQDFDSATYVTEWLKQTVRRPNQKRRKSYKKREGKKKVKVLIDMSSSEDEGLNDGDGASSRDEEGSSLQEGACSDDESMPHEE